jgi:DMSO/TMAO reductase YedYZ heme-binding membrane subunit
MSARSGQLRDRRQVRPKKHVSTLRLIVSIIVILVFAAGIGAGDTKTGERIADAAQRFLIFYSGVFALVALTGAVVVGLVATDRVIMSAGNRIVGQAVHRAVAFIAVAFLVTHIAMEIVVGKSDAIDSVVPFLSHGKTFYVGLGTIASDLIVLIAATGIARRSFAEKSSPFVWRTLHGSAYLAWPLSIVHGLVAGRHPKPYVSWSYGACMIAVGLALVLRSVATVRPRPETRQAWPPDTGPPTSAAASFAAQAYLLQSQRAAAMAGISAGMPVGLAVSQLAGVVGAPAAASAMPWPGTAASHWPATPAGGMPVVPGTVGHTPAHGVPAAPGMQYHTPAAGMPVVPGTVAHTPAHGVPAAQYRTPARGMPTVPSTEPSPEYGAVPFEVQALHPALPDEQARRAAR